MTTRKNIERELLEARNALFKAEKLAYDNAMPGFGFEIAQLRQAVERKLPPNWQDGI